MILTRCATLLLLKRKPLILVNKPGTNVVPLGGDSALASIHSHTDIYRPNITFLFSYSRTELSSLQGHGANDYYFLHVYKRLLPKHPKFHLLHDGETASDLLKMFSLW